MSENLHLEENDNSIDSGWEELKDLANKSPESKILPLYTEVNSGYKISSMPFDNKEDAYEEINNSWQGAENVTTYFDNGKWYIISK